MVSFVVAITATLGMVFASPSMLPPGLRSLVGLGRDRVAAAPSGGSADSYRFMEHQEGDPEAPVGYDPCQRIAIRINLEHAPDDGLELVEKAMHRVETASGLRFDYEGETDARPHRDEEVVTGVLGQGSVRPVLVSWATDREVPRLKGSVAGIGGSTSVMDGHGYRRYVTGDVILDADIYKALARTSKGRDEAVAIAEHEFGHLVGLAHVNDPGELMYRENVGKLDFGPGDLAGLARVGSTPCA